MRVMRPGRLARTYAAGTPRTIVQARQASAIPMDRKMVSAYRSQTSNTQRRVKPLVMPLKKLLVNPAITDMHTGTIRNAQTSSVNASWNAK